MAVNTAEAACFSRSAPSPWRSGRCRAARPSRCDRTSGCSAPPIVATVRIPQPLNIGGPARSRRPAAPARGGDAGEQHLARVRGHDATGLFGAIERDRVYRQLLAPEFLFERLAQRFGLRLQLLWRSIQWPSAAAMSQRGAWRRTRRLELRTGRSGLAPCGRRDEKPRPENPSILDWPVPPWSAGSIRRSHRRRGRRSVSIQASAACAFGHRDRTVSRSPVRTKYSPSSSTNKGVASTLP
jgi:hypothetical protein